LINAKDFDELLIYFDDVVEDDKKHTYLYELTQAERDVIVDALILYKEMNTFGT
jgi:hypothetical protein